RGSVGVDRTEDYLADGDVVRVVHVEVAAVAPGRIHREDRVRAVDAHLPGDVLTDLEGRIEVAILVVEERDVLDAQNPRGLALLGEPDIAELLAGHRLVLRAGR